MKLHSYQKKAVQRVLELRRSALFIPMGAGKTAIALHAMQELKNKGVGPILVICPLRVVSQWIDERKKWSNLDLVVRDCTGSVSRRRAALISNSDVHVINRDNVSWLTNETDVLNKFLWKGVVIDESTSFKSHATGRFKSLNKVIHGTKFLLLMSGLPAPQSLMDLWAQFYLIDRGERLGKFISHYRDRYFTKRFSPFGVVGYDAKPKAAYHVTQKVAGRVVRLNPKTKLPTKVDVDIKLDLPMSKKSEYKRLHDTFVLKLSDKTIKAKSAAVLASKLTQFSNGALYDEDKNYHIVHNEKIEALKDIVNDNSGENLIVVYKYISDKERIMKAFPFACLLSKSGKEIAQWNGCKIKLLLIHPASAAHGLNLQYGGSIIVWFGLPWSLEHWEQTNARLYRQGQTKSVRIITLCMRGTIDTHIAQILRKRISGSREILQYLKEHHERI